MDSDEAFLGRLAEHPDDDVTRLVYADWLDERGDRRAAYLRAEVALCARAPAEQGHAEAESLLAVAREGVDADWLARVGRPHDLVLHGYAPEQKILVIKTIRELIGCPLAEAKAASESLPSRLLTAVPRLVAEQWRERLRELRSARVSVELAPSPADAPVFLLTILGYRMEDRVQLADRVRYLNQITMDAALALLDLLPAVVRHFGNEAHARAARASIGQLAEVVVTESKARLPLPALPMPYPPCTGPCDVRLLGVSGLGKIPLIRALADLTGQGLRECKAVIDAPMPAVLLRGLTWEQAIDACRRIGPVARLQIVPAPH